MSNDALEDLVKDMEKVLNKQLPKTKRSLSELLKMGHPHVICRDGSAHSFKSRELETLSSLLPTESWDKLMLPIVITSNAKYGEGASIVSGEYEVQVTAKVLNIEIEEPKKTLIIYRPQLVELRRRLRTVTQVAVEQSQL